ncbi:pyrroline-5-carboxylate reductase [Aliiglaciecola litoralis]|uniref:Pyrroline-5-carboxylate reductase n=1 Tax=Aliiglaciecola litoralis TaxID=582857 RepID=A0ABP3WS53_9ALTE
MGLEESLLDANTKIAFIGGDSMAKAMLSGLIKHGHPRDHLLVTSPNNQSRQEINQRYFINTDANYSKAVHFADVIVLAVESEKVSEMCLQLNDEMEAQQQRALVICVAAGVSFQQLSENLGGTSRIVCAMPNMSSSICKGLTGLYSSSALEQDDRLLCDQIMQAVGETVWLQTESLMSSIVATSGSSPAYFYLFMEAMEKAAIEQGLDPDIAKSSILQSALGAVSIAMRSEKSLSELRKDVASSKGSTEKAVSAFQSGDIDGLVSKAMKSAAKRVDEIYQRNN